MTKNEIKQKFLAGESLVVQFGIRNRTYYLGGQRITELQYTKLIADINPKNRDCKIIINGLTEHKITFKS